MPQPTISIQKLFPPYFATAREFIRQGIARTVAGEIPEATTLAVLMAETLPRLVNAYGPARAAVILSRLAHDIHAGLAPNCQQQ
ncbi:MAG: hypothetical protein AB7V13_11125 [Pseudorhodoplanes sp.]|uniref:hypothetical protein n=1 Tax=Pseudorhodoplanes sp. TaxID=1934341 RepID=UPI003D0DEB84